jgi:glyoxylase-like metal-dependent hydrolase (beta-lactamase superfamily II)
MGRPAVNHAAGVAAEPDWTTPGAFEVAPGVFRIPLPLPNDALRAVNVYAVEDDSEVILIDSGWALALARDRLDDALAGLGHKISDIAWFLMTHVHRDHYTQAVILRREFGTRLSLGIGERPSLDLWVSGQELRLAPQLRRLRRCGARSLADQVEKTTSRRNAGDTPWEFPDEWLAAGDITLARRILQAIPTPGHTQGQLCFWDVAGSLLFSGDHVLPHITPSIGFEPAIAILPLGDYLHSLRLIRELPDATLLPAHGPPAASVHARVDELLAYHVGRLEAAEQAVRHGAATALEVARMLTWTRRRRKLVDLDVFSQMLAVLETAAHLDVLVMQGHMQATGSDGITGYVIR